MKKLILHIPQLYEHRSKWNMSATQQDLTKWRLVKENGIPGSCNATETILTSAHEVLIADYKADQLTILQTKEFVEEWEGRIINHLNEKNIGFRPKEVSFIMERPASQRNFIRQ